MKRREFLAAAVGMGVVGGRTEWKGGQGMTVKQVIDALLSDIPGAPFPSTVDTIKAGSPDVVVKGIVTTMFATEAVINKTIELGANFIIAHEPTFYNHQDETNWLVDDPVFKHKKELLDQHGIVVWRFHDGLHSHQPDGVRVGILDAVGWGKYFNAKNPTVVEVPSVSMGDVIEMMKKGLGIEKVRYIGDKAQACRKILLLPGAAGGRRQIGAVQQERPDLLIVGELSEWETAEYIRDARYQGGKIGLIVLGHSVSEEPGLEWLVPVVRQRVPGITVTHIASGSPFSFE
ncbi:MAG: Nif3-like dinuclear metal center hexameric protein [Bacteroidetes bacterium]|nr:Nif3-like dinuclear metal center hexameric protein [Bacteroidota bacterium]